MAIAEKVTAIIVEQLGVDRDEVTPDATFVHDLGADSLDRLELALACEAEFGIVISDDDVMGMATVADLVKFIGRRTTATT